MNIYQALDAHLALREPGQEIEALCLQGQVLGLFQHDDHKVQDGCLQDHLQLRLVCNDLFERFEASPLEFYVFDLGRDLDNFLDARPGVDRGPLVDVLLQLVYFVQHGCQLLRNVFSHLR